MKNNNENLPKNLLNNYIERPPWTSKYKNNWDEAYDNIMAWWEGGCIDRPVVFSSYKNFPSILKRNTQSFQPINDPGTNELRDLDESFIFETNEYFLKSCLFLAEDAPRVGTSFGSGISMLGGMAGAKLHYKESTVWFEPDNTLFEKSLPEFFPDYIPFKIILDILQKNLKYYGYDCIIGADAMMDPITTLSLMRGVEGLCIDIIDKPNIVKLWLNRLSEMYFKIAKEYMDIKKQYNRCDGWDVSNTGIWAPGEVNCLECDFSTLLSPKLFDEYVMPEIEKETELYEFCLWHLDGLDEVKHLESICSIKKIKGIQWVANKKDGPLNYIEILVKIKKFGKSLITKCLSVYEAIELTKILGKDGLALVIDGITDEKDMEFALKKLKQL